MKDLNIRPGVVLILTNVRVMLRLDPQHPSHIQRHVYLSSTAESQVNIWTRLFVVWYLLICSNASNKFDADLSSRDCGLNFGLSLHLHPYFVYASSGSSGKSAHLGMLT